jgi:hypothetical protein
MRYEDLFKPSTEHLITLEGITRHIYYCNILPEALENENPFKPNVDGYYPLKTIEPNVEWEVFIKNTNKLLRAKHTGTSLQLSIKSGIAPSNLSNWKRGLDVGIVQLLKIAKGLGYNLKIQLTK